MKKVMNERGFIKAAALIVLFVVVVLIGFAFAQPYYRYWQMSSNTMDVLRRELGNVEQIRQYVLEEAEKLNVPLTNEDLQVSINDKKVAFVKGSWVDTADFYGFYQMQVSFNLDEEY